MSADDAREVDAVVRWRVRQGSLHGRRRWLDRRLAQADVVAPDGTLYQVRILRNLPFCESPLGPFDGVVPQQVSLAALIGANLHARGRTGWSVQVVRPATRWRSERVVHTHRIRGGSEVADAALGLAAAVQRGETPWDDQWAQPLGAIVKRVMNWE